jgi:microcystin degradation protein MlrC
MEGNHPFYFQTDQKKHLHGKKTSSCKEVIVRIALGSFTHESNSFSPVPGSWDHFSPREILEGNAIIEQAIGTKTEEGGILETAKQLGNEIVPLFSARSFASAGPIKREVYEAVRNKLLTALILNKPLDGVILVLHGAVLADGYPDATGEILQSFRSEIGREMPLIATLDLHANVTQDMVDQATALIGYHTAPHVDQFETGQRAISLMYQTIMKKVRPAMGFRKIPMILPGENGCTTNGPYAEVIAMVEALEKQQGILDASAYSVQPWLDIKDVGCSVVVITNGDGVLANREAARVANEFWLRRHAFDVKLTPVKEAIRMALMSDRHPYILSDSADAPSSGAPGDSTIILRDLLDVNPAKDCYLNIVDPISAKLMEQAGVGKEISARIGAKYASNIYTPINITGSVIHLSNGDFIHKGPAATGTVLHRGLTGVLRTGHIFIVVMSRPTMQWDPELYRSVGLEPQDAQIVVVKSPAAFRAAYQSIAAEILITDASGVCSPNLKTLPFKHIRRPIFPLDDPMNWKN